METVHIDNLPQWRVEHPDEKEVLVEHSDGKAIWIFNYCDPASVEASALSIGQYDAWGNFHFIDSEGTYHKVLTQRPFYNPFKF